MKTLDSTMQPKLNPRSGVTSRLSFIYSSYCKGTLHVHGFISFLQRFNQRGSPDYPNMDARNEYQIMPSFFFCYKTKFAIVMSVLNMKDHSNGFSVNQLPSRKENKFLHVSIVAYWCALFLSRCWWSISPYPIPG